MITMADEQEQPKEDLGKFTKMVKRQLKKGHNVNVGRYSKKTDLHGQPKAVIRIGDGKTELWFREGDDTLVIDKIVDGNWEEMVTINKPFCHLRTSAKLASSFNLPTKSDSDDDDDDDDDTLDLHEDVESAEEAEDFEEEFTAPSNKFAIVDASVLDSLDNELAEQAITVPVKYKGAVFQVIANYDDTILRNLTITPSEVEEGDTEVVKTTEYATLGEGAATLSNDDKVGRNMRKTIKGRDKKKGREVAAQVPDPTKVEPRRDKSKKDKRFKDRQAKRPLHRREAEKMHEKQIKEEADVIIALVDGDESVLDQLGPEGLQRIGQILNGIINKPELSELHSRAILLNENISEMVKLFEPNAESIVDYVECLKRKKNLTESL
jgi:hypothetical protein